MNARSEAHLPHEVLPLKLGKASGDRDFGSIAQHFRSEQIRRWCFNMLLVLSLASNAALIAHSLIQESPIHNCTTSATKYAGLKRDVPKVYDSSSSFGTGNPNETDRSILWESLDTSAGEISLDKEWATAHGLPDSTTFFWDHERSIYLLNAYHSLHCLRKVRRWVTLAYYNRTQLDSYPHLVHCMDHLLQNIICEADDSPMYTMSKPNAGTGLGQQRMCRSWDKLAQWASDRTACFGYINETQGVSAVIERFRYCPPESPFLESMRRSFGYQDDWFTKRPEDIDTIPPYWEGFVE